VRLVAQHSTEFVLSNALVHADIGEPISVANKVDTAVAGVLVLDRLSVFQPFVGYSWRATGGTLEDTAGATEQRTHVKGL